MSLWRPFARTEVMQYFMVSSGNSTTGDMIRLVDGLLIRAVTQRASDAHFEPTEKGLLVRFRLDGVLHDVERLPAGISENVVARLKVMAGLLTYRIDIPQEGSLPSASVGGSSALDPLDMRVATFPTIRGERAVVRLLYSGEGIGDLDRLGIASPAVTALRSLAEQPSGMLIVTGPAGSGKSTTLYAIARHILRVTPGRSVVALEDPVEQRVEGMTQIQISPHGELDYPTAMRSLLRQDPQVLLVGEVRDARTAGVILEAALTGHLLLTTMHSGDPAEAVVRLLEMGIPPYQLVSTLSAVCSQRLVRKLCLQCRRTTGRADEPFARGACDACHQTGYHGRTACAELFLLNEAARTAVLSSATAGSLREIATRQGPGLLQDAARLVREGQTDAEEVRRVIGRPLVEGA
jgi:general secretion pathway protein E